MAEHAFQVIEPIKLLRCIGVAGTDTRHLAEWAAAKIERLEAERAEMLEALRAIYKWYDFDGSVGAATDVFEENRAILARATADR